MSDTSSDTSPEATEQTALMDGHIVESRPDRENTERNARKRKSRTESQRTYGGVGESSGSASDPGGNAPPQAAPVLTDPMVEELELKFGSRQVIRLCMFVVVATITAINFYAIKDIYLTYKTFHEESPDESTNVSSAIAMSIILLVVIVIMTVLVIVLCYKVIHGWLKFSSLMLLFIFSYLYIEEFLRGCDIPCDFTTLAIVLWNFGVIGMVAVQWKGPRWLQHAYLIFIAAIIGLLFITYLPEWTTWAVLVVFGTWGKIFIIKILLQLLNNPDD